MRRRPFWIGVVLAVLMIAGGSGSAQQGQNTVSANATLSSATCPGTGCVRLNVAGYGSWAVQIGGSWGGGTLVFECSVNNSAFQPWAMTPSSGGTSVTDTNANGSWTATNGIGGETTCQVRFSPYSSGSAIVTMRASPATPHGSSAGGGGGGTGTVTSVGMSVPSFLSVTGSPVTTSGSFAVSLATESANLVFAGPTNGAAATPTFRALVAADIPTLSLTSGSTVLLGNGSGGFANYAGTSCTNQFPRSLSTAGAATCASVANADLAGSIAASKLVGTDIATIGTITTGTWNGTVISPTYGGTGVNNGSSTFTIGGNTAFSGAFATTLTVTGATAVTLPTTGNLMASSGSWTDTDFACVTGTTGKQFVDCGAKLSDFLSLAGIVQGDLIYGSGANTITTLAKNTTATRYLSNTGTSNNPAWAQVDLSNGVTGDLPYANLTASSAASKLLGRGDSGAGDWQEITIGSGLSMSGTTLSASGSSGANTALSNLSAVAINTALLDDAAAADDFGSATLPWKDFYLAGSSGTPGTNNFKITGASTSGTRTITLPDESVTLGALSAISAASAARTIASGNNSGQVWNWALTSNSVTAFAFGETTAATSGTSDNQVILGVNTLSTSTAIPFYVKCYGAATDCLRVDDVSGDTTPFTIDAAGAMSVGSTITVPFAVAYRAKNSGGTPQNLISIDASDFTHIDYATGTALVIQRAGVNALTLGSGNMTVAFNDLGAPATILTVTPPNYASLTASTEDVDVNWNLSHTLTFPTGALTLQRAMRIQGPKIGFAAASTLSTAATLEIDSAPKSNTNATITSSSALLISAGAVQPAGAVTSAYGITTNAPTGATNNYALNIATGDVVIANGGGVDTTKTAGQTFLLQAYDVDGAAYKTFLTCTANNTPDCSLVTPAGATITVDASTYKVGGAATITGATCTVWTSGLCTTAAPSPEAFALQLGLARSSELEALRSEVAALRAELAATRVK